MTYQLTFVADMGSSNTGLTLRAQLYDNDGTPNGAEITTGFVEVDAVNAPGLYLYKHTTIPDGHDGTFVMYDNADKTKRVGFSVAPDGSTVADIWSYATRTLTAFGDAAGAERTYTVTSGGVPISSAAVWISTDSSGINIIWRGATNEFGIALDAENEKPRLGAGTYYFWVTHPSYVADAYPDVEVFV